MAAFTSAYNAAGEMAMSVEKIVPLDGLFMQIGQYGYDWPLSSISYSQRWPALIQIEQNRVADLLRQRQRLLAAALPADGDASAAPIDVGKSALSDLASAQPEPGQKQDHCPIPRFEDIVGTRADYPLDIFRYEKPGHG